MKNYFLKLKAEMEGISHLTPATSLRSLSDPKLAYDMKLGCENCGWTSSSLRLCNDDLVLHKKKHVNMVKKCGDCGRVGVVSVVQQMGEDLLNGVETIVMKVEVDGLLLLDEVDFQFQWTAHLPSIIMERRNLRNIINDEVDAKDRISELPESIIHHILSFLFTKDVAKTNLLSKRWKSCTFSFPVLDFNDDDFQDIPLTEMLQPDDCIWRLKYEPFRLKYPDFSTTEDFMLFVNKSLLKFCEQKICIDTFKLQVSFPDMEKEKARLVDRWIELAVENCVKVLDLTFKMKNKMGYILPQIDFSANTVTVLKLSRCKLEYPINLKNAINFYSLKELSLRWVYVVEETLHNLISRCPSIEHLTLIECWGFKKFQALKPLKYFCIVPEYRQSVYVEGSSFRYLHYKHATGRLGEIQVNACQNLRELYLSSASITDQWLYDLNTKFPHLHSLTLYSCNKLEKVHISSHSLKSFTLNQSEKLRKAEIDTPNLQDFIFDSSFKNPFPKLSFKSAPHQTTAKFHLLGGIQLNTDWLFELRDFLENPIQTKTLFLGLSYGATYNLEEFIPTSPPYDLELLELYVSSPPTCYSDFVDGLLLTCHPKTLLVNSDINFAKFLCGKLLHREDSNCCCSSRIRCWMHCLKNVIIEKFRENEVMMPLDEDTLFGESNKDEEIQFKLLW